MNYDDNEYNDLINAAVENVAFVINDGKPMYAIRQKEGWWRPISVNEFEGVLRRKKIRFTGWEDDSKISSISVMSIIDRAISRYSRADNHCGDSPFGELDLMNFPKITVSGTRVINGVKSFDMKDVIDDIETDCYGDMIFTDHVIDKIMSLLKPILYHIKTVLAMDDEVIFMYILAWLADILKYPTEKPGIALCIRGKQGAGKGMLFCWFWKCVIGTHNGLFTANMGDIGIGRDFNEGMEGKIFVVLDDVGRQNGMIKNADQVKNLITEASLTINPKGRPIYTTKNNARFVVLSNHDIVAKLESDDRRHTALECSDKHVKDRKYLK